MDAGRNPIDSTQSESVHLQLYLTKLAIIYNFGFYIEFEFKL